MERIIVSRHPAAIEFVREAAPEFKDAPVLTQATPDDVRGKVIAGNLPLHLAALAAQIVAVEFDGTPPRGAEYGVAEMKAAGARLARYAVTAVPEPAREITFNNGRKSRGHSDVLIVGRGDQLHKFSGASVPGVAAVVGSDYTQNGKWSHTVYRLRLAFPAQWDPKLGIHVT